jgi:hypothetical protein
MTGSRGYCSLVLYWVPIFHQVECVGKSGSVFFFQEIMEELICSAPGFTLEEFGRQRVQT